MNSVEQQLVLVKAPASFSGHGSVASASISVPTARRDNRRRRRTSADRDAAGGRFDMATSFSRCRRRTEPLWTKPGGTKVNEDSNMSMR